MNSKNDLYLFAQIIPAEQGYYALDLHGERDTNDEGTSELTEHIMVWPEPVIGWGVEFERGKDKPLVFVTPICQAKLSSL